MKGSARALALVIAGATLLAFGTPLRALWADAARPWWTVYALWAAAVAALVWLGARTRDGSR
jgi:membrane protein implicated in regulation of membrane protease activity